MSGTHIAAPRVMDWRRALFLDGPQALLIVVAFVQIVRCSGPAYMWLFVGLAFPLLRLAASPAYRRSLLNWACRQWATVEEFTHNRGPLPWRAAGWLIVLPAGLFFLSNSRPIRTGDSKPIPLTVAALLQRGTTDLSPVASQYASVYCIFPGMDLPYFCVRTPSGVYSRYPAGMLVFALPSAVLARMLGADLSRGGVQDRLEKSVASWVAAACLGLFFLLALHLTDERSAAVMTLLLATGSGMCSTIGQALWQHGGVLFWMLLALLIEFRTWQQPRWSRTLLQGLALSMMFACRLSSAVLIAPFGLWLFVRAPRRAILVGLAAAVCYLPWACFYQSIYGTPLGPSSQQMAEFTGRWRETLIPLLISPDHGLLVYQPWILLALTLAFPSVRRRLIAANGTVPSGWIFFCTAAIVLHTALVATWSCWWGGHCWGSRLLVETVPFLALLCLPVVAALRRLAWGRRLLLATGLLAAFVHLTGVYLKVDFRDEQPALIGTRHEPPGSWTHWPFLTPFVGSLHSYR